MAPCFSKSPFDCLLIDLDDTLYSPNLGISQACKRNISEFLSMKCGLTAEQSSSLRIELFKKYGSSLAGLMALGYEVHPDEYHSFVHGSLPYEKIRPDSQLRDLLLSIPQTKIVFTNSDREHTRRALERLGVEDCFDKVICFETLNPGLFELSPELAAGGNSPAVILKPFISAIEAAVEIAGFEPHRTLFLDDSEKNIAAGKAVGLCTILVGKSAGTETADVAIESICSLAVAIPELWGEEKATRRGELIRPAQLDAIRPSTAPIEA